MMSFQNEKAFCFVMDFWCKPFLLKTWKNLHVNLHHGWCRCFWNWCLMKLIMGIWLQNPRSPKVCWITPQNPDLTKPNQSLKEPLSQFQKGFSKFLKTRLSDLTVHSQTSSNFSTQFPKKNQPKKKSICVSPSLLFHDFDGLCDCLGFILPHLASLLEVTVTGFAIGRQFRQVGAFQCRRWSWNTKSHHLWDVKGRTWKWLMLWGIRNYPRIFYRRASFQTLNTASFQT